MLFVPENNNVLIIIIIINNKNKFKQNKFRFKTLETRNTKFESIKQFDNKIKIIISRLNKIPSYTFRNRFAVFSIYGI